MTDCGGNEAVEALIIQTEEDLLLVVGYLITHSSRKTIRRLSVLAELGLNPDFVKGLITGGRAEFEKRTSQHPAVVNS